MKQPCQIPSYSNSSTSDAMQDLETIKYDFPDFTAATALCQKLLYKNDKQEKKPHP